VSVKSQQNEMQTARLDPGSYMCTCLWVASVAKRDSIEQIEVDIASARVTLANASARVHKMCKGAKGPRG
jgi:hypothetical protein